MKNRYAACVVLFKPDMNVADNIESYIGDVDIVYAINNDVTENAELKAELLKNDKIRYINNKESKGLAYALNVGAKRAVKDGYDYLLTMDQDSRFADGAVRYMIDFIENSNIEYGIVGANANALYYDELSKSEKISYIELERENEICNWCMTSGSMTNLKCYMMSKGFDEKMFIGHVDVEYGIQMAHINKPIIKLKEANLYQHFGNLRPVRFLWKTVHPTFDSPQRIYYLFRNQKYLKKMYPREHKLIGVKLNRYIIKILCYEEDKMKKIAMAIRGYIDGSTGKMGQCSY